MKQFHSFHNNNMLSIPKRDFATKIYMRIKKSSSLGGGGIDGRNMSPLYKPKTANQELYVKYLNEPSIPIVLGLGPAGSGKTLFACNQAVMALKSGAVDKIIMTRPVVTVEEDIGFLPGNLIHKMDPWTRPIFDIMLEYYTQKDIDSMLHGGVFEISPLAYMRGRTFKNAFIIADEMQNSSPNQMLMMTTRIGDNSKMVITGDLKQSDRGKDNGLLDFMTKMRTYENYCLRNNITLPNIRLVEMDSTDIQRSPIVEKLIHIYSLEDQSDRITGSVFKKIPSVNEKKSKKSTDDGSSDNTGTGTGTGSSNNTTIVGTFVEKGNKKNSRLFSTKRDDDAALIPIWDLRR
jgi:phosphate starvation-inducible PhoH-like protein